MQELLCTPWNCEDDDPDSPWQLMRQDMDVSAGDHDDLAVYTIAWALKMVRVTYQKSDSLADLISLNTIAPFPHSLWHVARRVGR